MPAPIAAPASDTTPSNATPSQIPENYDATGRQVVEAGVLDFDAEGVDTDPNSEAIVHEVDPIDPPQDPAADPAKPVEPVKPAVTTPVAPAEAPLILGKFKTEQDLKNAFIELGGDPARFTDPKLLEEAYQVRESETSRSRAQLKAAEPVVPTAPLKSFQEMIAEEVAKYDPSKFEGPADMWKAQNDAMAAAAQRFEDQMKNNQPQPLDPAEVDRNIKSLTALHDLETKVPRLKSDTKLRQALAGHIRQLRDEGKMPHTPEGYEDPAGAFRDMIQNQQAVVEEASAALEIAKSGKDLSSTVNADSANPNPASAPKRDAGDAIIDDLLGAKALQDKKYGN